MGSSDIAVSVRGLSKAYTIAHEGERHVTLAEQMLSRIRRPFAKAKTETFWALKDVSFDIKKGDVVGIIGRNGAGKSTLLKILSRITEPTGGEIDLYGRVGSLLEVGTGFHPELTGRENVFLNGAILGMTKADIRKHFDAIVDFAEVDHFIDTPVKRYSSGMYVRLAFAVAAHLNSDILIVDEVLAVGDAAFQKKCIGKMGEVAAIEGRTILFVSHSIPAIQRLCSRGICLDQGHLAVQGELQDAVNWYLSTHVPSVDKADIDLRAHGGPRGNGPVRFVSCAIIHEGEAALGRGNRFSTGEPIGLRFCVNSSGESDEVAIGYAILDINGTVLFTSHHDDTLSITTFKQGKSTIESWMRPNPLLPGQYILQLGILCRGARSDYLTEVAQIEIEPVLGSADAVIDIRPGALRFDFPWNFRPS